MPEYVSILQLTGVSVLALAMGVWIAGLIRLLRAPRRAGGVRHHGDVPHRSDALRALPRQRQAGPALESVKLTLAERDAFAGLVRQFSDGRS